MKDHVRDDVRDESLGTPLYKGFLLKNVRDGLVQEKAACVITTDAAG